LSGCCGLDTMDHFPSVYLTGNGFSCLNELWDANLLLGW